NVTTEVVEIVKTIRKGNVKVIHNERKTNVQFETGKPNKFYYTHDKTYLYQCIERSIIARKKIYIGMDTKREVDKMEMFINEVYKKKLKDNRDPKEYMAIYTSSTGDEERQGL